MSTAPLLLPNSGRLREAIEVSLVKVANNFWAVIIIQGNLHTLQDDCPRSECRVHLIPTSLAV